MIPFTFATLLSGGGLGALGLQAAGGVPLWAVDIRPDIAACYERNLGSPCAVADVTVADWQRFAVPYVALLTPSCKNASSAKVGAGETDEDRAVARGLVRYIAAHTPPVVLLENVWGYRLFESFQMIVDALTDHGYAVDYQHINAADFGVPQTRKRLILRAVRWATAVPVLTPTHSRTPDWFHAPWNGWYAAIEDLLPTLPESAFAPWQLARLPDLVTSTLVLPSNINVESRFHRDPGEPAATVTAASLTKLPVRAYLVPGANDFRAQPDDHPAVTVTSDGRRTRAYLVEGTGAGDDRPVTVRRDDEPMWTIRGAHRSDTARALIVDSQYSGTPGTDRVPVMRDEADPMYTVSAGPGANRPARAYLPPGRVVQMTPRALARFQTLPDSYELPDKAALACEIIGNGLPCLLAQRVVESVVPL